MFVPYALVSVAGRPGFHPGRPSAGMVRETCLLVSGGRRAPMHVALREWAYACARTPLIGDTTTTTTTIMNELN